MKTRTESAVTVISSRLLYIQYFYLYFSFCLLPLFSVPPPPSPPCCWASYQILSFIYCTLRLCLFPFSWRGITLEGVGFLFNILKENLVSFNGISSTLRLAKPLRYDLLTLSISIFALHPQLEPILWAFKGCSCLEHVTPARNMEGKWNTLTLEHKTDFLVSVKAAGPQASLLH